MLNQKIVDLVNKQINLEWYSAYFYLEVYAYYTEQGLDGFANWFRIQAQEERDHAMMFMDFVTDGSGKLAFEDIKASKVSFEDYAAPLQAVFDHELKISASINAIYAEASKQKDFRTMQFLDFFVKEQGEEEKSTQDLIQKFKLFAGDARGLYMLNSELAGRSYSPIAAN